ncbi:hypothetical protein DL93DRAFT_2161917 [Clavulina sp. PMI_390]|nr:hypothetical protein DL93DRAFT_2161917 [Clavulina sp. PMI_390]
MLSPSSLTKTLAHPIGPDLRLCLLLTPQSRLIAYASYPPNTEDLMKVLLGLSAEAWRDAETQARLTGAAALDDFPREEDFVRIDSELGRVLVMPIYPLGESASPESVSSSLMSEMLDSATPKFSQPPGTFPRGRQPNRRSSGSDGTESSNDSRASRSIQFLLALNAPSSVPWGLMRAKGRHLRSFLGSSLGEIGAKLEAQSNDVRTHPILR